MAFSINVNESALTALRNLTATNDELATTQTRINTGLAVSSPRDNAAIFSIAQELRADLRGLTAVEQSLDRGISTIDVALAAATAVADLLLELQERAVAAADAGLDDVSRQALNEDFVQLREQISRIVENAEFNGTNLLDGNQVGGVDNIRAIINSDATQTLDIDGESLSLRTAGQAPIAADILQLTVGQNIDTQPEASATVGAIRQSIINLNAALTRLGSGATALDQSRVFNTQLSDVIEVGIGNLVDADLAEESANLQALQVQQSLGIQALTIANQAPQAILSLFQ